MATYTIKDDLTGKTFDIEGEEGATQEELLQAAKEYMEKGKTEILVPRSKSQALKEGLTLGLKGIGQVVGLQSPTDIAKFKEEIATTDPSTKQIQSIAEMLPGMSSAAIASTPVGAGTNALARAGIPYLSRSIKALAPIIEGAAGGAVAGGTMPSTTEEGQAEGAKTGAMIGAGIPTVTRPLGASLGFLRDLITKGGHTRNAADFILEAVGPKDIEPLVAKVKAGAEPDPILGTEHTTAAIAEDPRLAALQKGVQFRYPEFAQKERANDILRRDYLRDLKPSEADINMLLNERDVNTRPLRQALSGNPDIEALASELEFRQGKELTGTGRYNVLSDMVRALRGDNTLSNLEAGLKIRENTAKALSGRPGSFLRDAPAEDAFTMEQLNLIDDELNRATGGEFGNYNRAFSRYSEPVDEARALTNIVDKALESEKSNLNPDSLSRHIRKFGSSPFGPNLSAATEQNLSHLADDIAKEAYPHRFVGERAGHEMAAKLEALQQLEGPLMGFHTPIFGAMKIANILGRSGRERALKDMLVDPQKFSTAMTEAVRRFKGPSGFRKSMGLERNLVNALIANKLQEE